MNPEKAIEDLKDIQLDHAHIFDADDLNAIQLGIEALKRHQNKASLTFTGIMEPLPGETKD